MSLIIVSTETTMHSWGYYTLYVEIKIEKKNLKTNIFLIQLILTVHVGMPESSDATLKPFCNVETLVSGTLSSVC